MKHQIDSDASTTAVVPDGWVKASESDSGGNCVEVYFDGDTIRVRDSKDREGPQLVFTTAEFDAFKHGVRHGEFDR